MMIKKNDLEWKDIIEKYYVYEDKKDNIDYEIFK